MSIKGIYIHIPFCKRKCYYCDFISYENKKDYIYKYIEALKKELNLELDKYEEISTVYIGGGTPSYIDYRYIIEVLDIIKNKQKHLKEITIEVNPGTVTEESLNAYRKAGINRLSIGLQETNNNMLETIGRIHTYEQFLETYKLARKLGFTNINIDLIIGLPNQTLNNIKGSLEKIINLNPEHISVYSLILEEGTHLYNQYKNNKIFLPSEDKERKMYWYVKQFLEDNGYIHYEISNFAKNGYESKHNLDCWNQEEYIGFGVAAHSYKNRIRYSNTEDIQEYVLGVVAKKNYQTTHEVQNIQEQQKEYMLLGLRKIKGVSIQKFKNKFAENPIYIFRKQLKKLVEQELLEIDGDDIKLTNKGIDLANLVWGEFV